MRAKWAVLVVGVCLVVTAVAIAYAAGKSAVPVQEVVRAKRFEVVDARGKVRAEIGPLEDGRFGVLLYGQGKYPVVRLDTRSGPGGDVGMLIMHGEKGDAWLGASPFGTGLRMRENELPFRECVMDAAGITLNLAPPPPGTVRAIPESELRAEWQRSPSPDAARKRAELSLSGPTAESSLVLFDKEGKVLWQAP